MVASPMRSFHLLTPPRLVGWDISGVCLRSAGGGEEGRAGGRRAQAAGLLQITGWESAATPRLPRGAASVPRLAGSAGFCSLTFSSCPAPSTGIDPGSCGRRRCCQSLLSEMCLCDSKQRPASVKVRSTFQSQERGLPGSRANPGLKEDLEQRW